MKLTTVGSVLAASALAEKQCERAIEMMILQDATTSFSDLGHNMYKSVNPLLDAMNEKLGTARASVAVFSDKSLPLRGNGDGRGLPEHRDQVYVNAHTYPLGTDPDQLKEGYLAVNDQNLEGGDYPEAVLEGMVYASLDPKVKWSPGNLIYDENRRRIVKVMVTITDDHPHYEGDGQSGVDFWNPVSPPDGYLRFGDAGFEEYGALYAGSDGEYIRLVELINTPNKNQAEVAEYEKLMTICGPAVYDDLLPHPGTFEASYADAKYEYPSLKTLGRVLNEQSIIPVLLLAEAEMVSDTSGFLCSDRGLAWPDTTAELVDCLEQVYTKDFQDAGVERFIIGRFQKNDPSDLIDNIVSLVEKVSEDVTCPDDPTPGPETTIATTTTMTKASPGTAPSDDGASTGNSDSDPTAPSTDDDQSTDYSSSSSTTDEAFIIPPVIPPVVPGPADGGSNTGVIAGAAGGAVAGVAALGGVLYKSFGASLFGHSAPGDLGAVEQVEVPETPVEREAFEEVTMDMFQ